MGNDLPVRIGLTTYREAAAWGVWNEPADLLPSTYADCVVVAGGVPLLLPPAAVDRPGAAAAAVAACDGLIIAGGADVAPERYDAERSPRTGPARTDRDAWELAVLAAATDAAVPVLAICRGMQVLNVARGGDLIQHLPDTVGTDVHCPTVGQHGRHVVDLDPHRTVGRLLGPRTDVATYHHQAVGRLGDGLVATGWAEDGTVEAVELVAAPWVVGVQWHPEAYDGARLFAGFLAACDRHRRAAAPAAGAP
ncbi:MAG TPA: gamma-glutamyl-gamma-aminobutyrate hydrolase family protein [Jatrophihabitans sp.]|uniref:gamma-glutamyl-gamma-aminobutyrate hydrolase family protein n=1 Tax=Jatrophihabitans sp. TaxID=1932789 RepID=UPI002E072BA5|nr:gamma-glutamyl-gamma-aminobutyrate hydrolase family protein [Jatrophihabitans sp.]HEV7204949.1 gamma-glutamyl-gamma-aminobutyrate hydrolase family protein [Jatrophihabitans sp.]